MPRVAIALGSNLGRREAHLSRALRRLAAHPRIRGLRASRFVETEPEGGPQQGRYLNAAAAFQTDLPAGDLLALLQRIEREEGRRPGPRWGPRPLDLDLLLYGSERIRRPGLELPHPRMGERLFVLGPLAEIAPRWVHPGFGLAVEELRDRLLGPNERVRTGLGAGAERV